MLNLFRNKKTSSSENAPLSEFQNMILDFIEQNHNLVVKYEQEIGQYFFHNVVSIKTEKFELSAELQDPRYNDRDAVASYSFSCLQHKSCDEKNCCLKIRHGTLNECFTDSQQATKYYERYQDARFAFRVYYAMKECYDQKYRHRSIPCHAR